MNVTAVAAAWALVTLDLALMGYRVEWGTSALLRKRRRHQLAALRLAALGQPAIALTVLVAAGLHSTGEPSRAGALDAALRGFLWVSVPYAAVIGAASLALLVPSVDVRAAASVLVFGPLTLLRPLIVVAATVGAAVVVPRTTDALVVALAAAVAVAGIALEVVLNRHAAARLLHDAGARSAEL